MVTGLNREVLKLCTREQGEVLVLNKIDELVRENNRLEQIVDFLSQIVNSGPEGNNDLTDENDVQ